MNSRRALRLFVLILISIWPVFGFAQSNADKLFNEGQQLQKVETVKSQNAAIKKYQQAKVLYTTETKKEQCDNQISICKNTIRRLRKESAKPDEPTAEDSVEPTVMPKPQKRDPAVQLSLSQTRLDFTYKPKDNFKPTIDVICNYNDWSIESKPDWIKVYTSDASISVEAEQNESEEDRSGIIKIVCDEASADLIINQDKANKANKMLDDAKGAITNVFKRKNK